MVVGWAPWWTGQTERTSLLTVGDAQRLTWMEVAMCTLRSRLGHLKWCLPQPENPMPMTPPKIEDRVAQLFSIHMFKLFHQNSDYVALFGEPTMADDGWIINLPASHVFEGDYHSLPFDVELQATWVNAQSTVKQPLANFISLTSPPASWDNKAASLGIANYGRPDLFRDLSSILINAKQPVLALSFIQVAHQLRPTGPLIREMLHKLTEQVVPSHS